MPDGSRVVRKLLRMRDSGRARHAVHSAGEVLLLVWVLGIFWRYYESHGFGELVLHLLGRAG